MFTAYNIKTGLLIGTAASRAVLCKVAEAKVGREGYCIREARGAEVLPTIWCSSDGQWWF